VNIHIFNTWMKVEKEILDNLLANMNYTRDGYCGGYYIVPERDRSTFVAAILDTGECYLEPEFFKPKNIMKEAL